MNTPTLPLVVDLDGSLVSTDMIYETFVRAIFKKPWVIFLIPIWLGKGIAYLKHKLISQVHISYSVLPFRPDLLSYLKEQKQAGRELILCTGSHYLIAQGVNEHLKLFDKIYSTEDKINLTGRHKAKLLRETYGKGNFDYLGNEHKDLKVWEIANSAIIVSNDSGLAEKVRQLCKVERIFPTKSVSLKTLLKAMRVHQWSKNLLLFVPAVAAHTIFEGPVLVNTLLAFVAFGLCASATYLINDLADLDSDRKHYKKRFRPLASGALPIKHSFALGAGLMGAAVLLAISISLNFLLVLGLYVLITLGYSFIFKRLQTVDIIILASLYTLRLFAGGAAAGVIPSFWLLAFSMFVFLCLALIKRISEIQRTTKAAESPSKIDGRGYYESDLNILTNLASASGMVSIIVFAMYVNSPEVTEHYTTPEVLWLGCPIIGYWIIRVLVMAARGQIDEDPIQFAIKDRRSWAAGAILAAVVTAATVI